MKTFIMALLLVSGSAYANCTTEYQCDDFGNCRNVTVCTDDLLPEYTPPLPPRGGYGCYWIEINGRLTNVCD